MLVLMQRPGHPEEEVVIRDAEGRILCEVSIGRVDRNKVYLGFVSPHQIRVNRRQVDEKIYGKPEGRT